MEFKGRIESVEVATVYPSGKPASEVLSLKAVLEQSELVKAILYLTVPLSEADLWPIGMPVTVTVTRGEPDACRPVH